MEKLTLDEAIKHAKEVADMNYNDAEKFDSNDSVENYMKANCMKCAEQHEKLAEWLEELKSYKDLEKRLHKIFGEESTFSLADVIDTLETKLSEPDKKHPVNARILTYEEADKWQEYKNLEEQGLLVRLPCKVGDVVWELCLCDDGNYKIFPMIVKTISEYGTLRQVKKDVTIWNIYAESDYTYVYKNFTDFGKTVFITKEEAEKKLEEF